MQWIVLLAQVVNEYAARYDVDGLQEGAVLAGIRLERACFFLRLTRNFLELPMSCLGRGRNRVTLWVLYFLHAHANSFDFA